MPRRLGFAKRVVGGVAGFLHGNHVAREMGNGRLPLGATG